MIVGFTGTRHGMTVQQFNRLGVLLNQLKPHLAVHGGGGRADEMFDGECRKRGIKRRVYPASNLPPELRAMVVRDNLLQYKDPQPALQRNICVIADSDVMIATPGEMIQPTDPRGHGTWYTIRHTREAEKPLFLILPNGVTQEERMSLFIKMALPMKIRPITKR